LRGAGRANEPLSRCARRLATLLQGSALHARANRILFALTKGGAASTACSYSGSSSAQVKLSSADEELEQLHAVAASLNFLVHSCASRPGCGTNSERDSRVFERSSEGFVGAARAAQPML